MQLALMGQPKRGLLLSLIAALGFFLAHVFLATALPERFSSYSTLMVVVAELVVACTCLIQLRGAGRARTLWGLLSFSLLLQAIATALDFRAEILNLSPTNPVPGLPVLFSALYSVPLLFAVSLRTGPRIPRTLKWLSALLPAALAFLFYVLIFSVISMQGSDRPEDLAYMANLFLVQDIFLAVSGTVRALSSEHPQERRFFSVVALFFWADTLLPSIHNVILLRHDYVWLDVLLSAPMAVLFVLLFSNPSALLDRVHLSRRATRIMRLASPIFPALALILLGLAVAERQYGIGCTGVLLGFSWYAVACLLQQNAGLEAEENLSEVKRTLEELVGVDGLTGIANRRAFDQRIAQECRVATRGRQPITLLMLDIDYFKLLNDSAGHLKGDEYLQQIARLLRKVLARGSDLVARYGGEEFSVILPMTDRQGGLAVATRLQREVTELRLEHASSPFGVVTISVGCATDDGEEPVIPQELVRRADEALYLAKRSGRNRVASETEIFHPAP